MTVQSNDYKRVFIGLTFFLCLIIIFQAWLVVHHKNQNQRHLENMIYSFEDKVEVALTYQAYACGECSSLFQIDSVLYAESNRSAYFINKEIRVEGIDELISSNNKKGNRHYVLSGDLMRNNYGMFQLVLME